MFITEDLYRILSKYNKEQSKNFLLFINNTLSNEITLKRFDKVTFKKPKPYLINIKIGSCVVYSIFDDRSKTTTYAYKIKFFKDKFKVINRIIYINTIKTYINRYDFIKELLD